MNSKDDKRHLARHMGIMGSKPVTAVCGADAPSILLVREVPAATCGECVSMSEGLNEERRARTERRALEGGHFFIHYGPIAVAVIPLDGRAARVSMVNQHSILFVLLAPCSGPRPSFIINSSVPHRCRVDMTRKLFVDRFLLRAKAAAALAEQVSKLLPSGEWE